MNEALEVANQCPVLNMGGDVEVIQILNSYYG
jgi:hypothetical protein